jgi:hypothetical protein
MPDTEEKSTQQVQQVININGSSISNKKEKKWPFSVVDFSDSYNEKEEEEIKKRLLTKIAEAYEKAPVGQDNSNLYDDVAKKFFPEIAIQVKEEFKKKAQVITIKVDKSLDVVETKEEVKTDDSIGNALIKDLSGNFGGSNKQAVKKLNNGLVIIKYDDIREFEKDLYNAAYQEDKSRYLLGLNNKKFTALTSVVEIAVPCEKIAYKVVVSDRAGVKTHNINKEIYENLINDASYNKPSSDLNDAQKLANREKLVSKIFGEIDKKRVAFTQEMKDFLSKECKNEVFGIPVPGIPSSGRKDRLKDAMRSSAFTFSDKDDAVVEQDRKYLNRYVVTINGKYNDDVFIPISNNCHVKVNGDGKIIPDTIYKLEKNGTRTEIDISGGIFRLPLELSGPVVKAFLPKNFSLNSIGEMFEARKKASEVMKNYHNLEVLVCNNKTENKGKLGMSFQFCGKTHGLELTNCEKLASFFASVATTGGFGFVTMGASSVTTVAVAAALTTVTGSVATKGFLDGVEKIEDKFVGKNSSNYRKIAEERKKENSANIYSNQTVRQ